VRVLISVSDKRELDQLANGLVGLGAEIYSTGNTARRLHELGIAAASVTKLTGFPEILDGRVKTLHPGVHAGILARRDLPAHMQVLAEQQIAPIDMVVVNLYPFSETITRRDSSFDDAIEQIDVGGPAMIRAAAKNHSSVLVVVDPADYAMVLQALETQQVTAVLRRQLAAKAFAHTAAYDAAIASYLTLETFPATLPLAFSRVQELRYGENPHQKAALYGNFSSFFQQLHGKELSYINILDIAAVQELIEEFDMNEGTALAIVKHTNPCGVGVGATGIEAWEKAFATDREAPFGGIIALNQPLDVALAQQIDEIFSEIIIAPAYDDAALELLRKKKNRRLMRSIRPVSAERGFLLHSVPGGVLVQQPDRAALAAEPVLVVSARQPTAAEQHALRFAWRVVKHVKSNAIVYATSDRTLGIGAGQMSRVDSSRVAAWKAHNAGLALTDCVVASDALFPFADGIETAAAAGATAVIQPGGSVRDQEIIDAANRLGMAMVFTGTRHFRH
jgi:phosphoribosylaminoimidazolecarboxamide formyltransferase / IMP cyclohydrolase